MSSCSSTNRQGVHVPPALPENTHRAFWEQVLACNDFSDQLAHQWTTSLEAKTIIHVGVRLVDMPDDPRVWVLMLRMQGCVVSFSRSHGAVVTAPNKR